jgi:hypothetical protein
VVCSTTCKHVWRSVLVSKKLKRNRSLPKLAVLRFPMVEAAEKGFLERGKECEQHNDWCLSLYCLPLSHRHIIFSQLLPDKETGTTLALETMNAQTLVVGDRPGDRVGSWQVDSVGAGSNTRIVGLTRISYENVIVLFVFEG